MIHGDRSVDVFVRKLRLKLQKRSPGWEYIHTHFEIGYRFDPQPTEPGGREDSVGASHQSPAEAAQVEASELDPARATEL
jgi:DNA-binding winged helix-turn-helix (wHTH) protein